MRTVMSQPPPLPYDLPEESHVPVAQPVYQQYTPPDEGGFVSPIRPGPVTTIGVMSIVLAVLQAGAAIMVAFMGFAIWIASVAPTPGQYPQSPASIENYPDGLQMHLAAQLSNNFKQLASLSPKRRDSLDALFRHSGRDVVPTVIGARQVTTADAKRLLLSHTKTSDGHDALMVPAGRIELSDTEATFEPQGSTEIVTVQTAEMSIFNTAPAATPAPTTLPAATTPPKIVLRDWQFLSWYGGSAVSALLSILLLIAGILTLRGNKGGRRSHLWWAWMKLPVAVFGAVGVGSLVYEFAEAGAQNGGTPNPSGSVAVGVMWGVIQGLLSVGYILAVLIVMNLQRTRDWFAAR